MPVGGKAKPGRKVGRPAKAGGELNAVRAVGALQNKLGKEQLDESVAFLKGLEVTF